MIRQVTTKKDRKGRTMATLEVRQGERIMIIREDGFYKLGGQIDDVVRGHVLLESGEVAWCSIRQEWAHTDCPVLEGGARE